MPKKTKKQKCDTPSNTRTTRRRKAREALQNFELLARGASQIVLGIKDAIIIIYIFLSVNDVGPLEVIERLLT